MTSSSWVRIFSIAAIASVLVVLIGTLPAVADAGWRGKQEKWWTTSESVYVAISALVRVRSLLPQGSEASGDITDGTIDLLVLLDADNSPHALDSLTKLADYNIGEAPAEVYACVVQRKGPKILGRLQDQLRSGTVDDCVSRFGATTTMCIANGSKDARHDRLKLLVSRIKADAACSIER
jgi:hypothetical protein